MSKSCGNFDVSTDRLERLADLGSALDREQQLCVFDSGLVGFDHETESEVIHNVSQGKAQGPQAGSRTRRRQASRPRRRSSGTGHHFRSDAHERAFGGEFRILAQHYEALAFEDKNGLWAVISSHPLGICGPQATFLIGTPFERRVQPRAWAFSRTGPKPRTFPLKHTNFPDASVCAFVKDDAAWTPQSGLTAFADHLTMWTVKSLHRELIGYWPGPQFGHGALYRRTEFLPQEWCGCRSGKRYGECHLATDLLTDSAKAHEEFVRGFGADYEVRAFSEEIIEAARRRWTKLPSLDRAFSKRPMKLEY